MNLYTIDTGFFKLDGGAMFGVVPKVIWEKINTPDAKNLCTWAMRCLLIEEGDRLVLIDCGMGDKQSEKFFGYYEPHGTTLEASLNQQGFAMDDITDVLLTHLHFDHCGGAIKREGDLLVPAFKNATYWSQREHWAWATHPNDREKASFLKENIMPIEESGQLKYVEDETILPGINYQLAYGHTEAQIIPHIQYKDKTIIYCADLIPSSGHIAIPYVMGYDVRPLMTMNEKKDLLGSAVQNNTFLFFEHDRSVECCTLAETERGIRKGEELRLQDIV